MATTNYNPYSQYTLNQVNLIQQAQPPPEPIHQISAAPSEPTLQTQCGSMFSLNYYPILPNCPTQQRNPLLPKKGKSGSKHSTPKVNFTPEEDQLLLKAVKLHGTRDWHKIAQSLPGRNTRQCRERWNNYVNPEISIVYPWTTKDDELLMKKYEENGPKWHLLSTFFTGRSTNSIKNRFIMLRRRRNRKILTDSIKAPTDQIYGYPQMYPNNFRSNVIQPTQSYINIPSQEFHSPPIKTEQNQSNPKQIQQLDPIPKVQTEKVYKHIDLSNSTTDNDPFAFMDLSNDAETISWSDSVDIMSTDWINTSDFW